jgi:hypothetical protein
MFLRTLFPVSYDDYFEEGHPGETELYLIPKGTGQCRRLSVIDVCVLLSILIICPWEFAACSKGQYDPVFIVDERPVLFEAYSPPMNLMRTLGNGLFIDRHLLWVKFEGKAQRFLRLSYLRDCDFCVY